MLAARLDRAAGPEVMQQPGSANGASKSAGAAVETLRRVVRVCAAGTLTSKDLGAFVDELSALQWPLTEQRARELVSDALLALMQQMSLSQSLVVTQYCQLAGLVFVKQQLHLSAAELERFMAFFLSVVQRGGGGANASPPWLQLDALRALGFLVFDNGGRVSAFHARLLDLLTPLVQGSAASAGAFDRDLQIAAVTCLGNLCSRPGSKLGVRIADVLALLLSKLRQCDASIREDSGVYKLTAATLRALHYVLLEAKTTHAPSPVPVFAMLHRLCFLGGAAGVPVGGAPSASTSATSAPAAVASASASVAAAAAAAKRTPSTRLLSSDSDIGGPSSSGATSGGTRTVAGARSSQHGKVRQYALLCLQSMARVNAKQLHPFWPQLLPTSSMTSVAGRSNADPDLCSLLHRDANPKVRSAAAGAIAAMLDGSRAYLTAARDAGTGAASFSSLSSTLGTIIVQLHARLQDAADSETALQPQVQIIKCLEALMSNVSYERLKPGLLATAVARLRLRVFASHTQHSVRVALLSCLAAAFSCPEPLPELVPIVTWEASDHDAGLISQLHAMACAPEAPADLVAEVLHVLARMAVSYRAQVMQVFSLRLAEPILTFLASAPDHSVRLAGARVLEELLRPRPFPAGPGASETAASATAATSASTDAAATTANAADAVAADAALWQQLLPALCAAFADESIGVRASLCTTLSHMHASVFQHLAKAVRVACVTAVLGAASDPAHQVRSAACRTLGVFALFPVLVQDDPHFLTNAATAVCKAVHDSQLSVRIRACWSLGNLCDALGTEMMHLETSDQHEDAAATERLAMLKTLAEVALAAGSDNDKVRCNAVRALGNLVGVAPPAYLDDDDGATLRRAVDGIVLHLCSGGVKVRWNAAVALGSVLRNPSLDLAGRRTALQPVLFAPLLKTIADRKNFKMRIHAARALLQVTRREQYGDQFVLVWQVVLQELQHIDDMEDYAEYRYKDSLRILLLKLVLQLLDLSRRVDFAALKSLLIEHAQFLYDTLDTLPAPFSQQDVTKAMVSATELFEAHMKTIPVQLLTRFQQRAFGK